MAVGLPEVKGNYVLISEFRGAAFNRASDQTLIFAAAAHVCRVEQGHPETDCTVDRGDGFLVIARAEEFRRPHASESEHRNVNPCVPSFRWFM
jgi:hypothetical protein